MDIAVTGRLFGANNAYVQILLRFLELNHILALKLRVNLLAAIRCEIVSQSKAEIFEFNQLLEVFF